MTDAVGLWIPDNVSRFNFTPFKNAGGTIAIGQMNAGYQRPNPNWGAYPGGFVQRAYDAKMPVVGGHYLFDLKHAPGAANQLFHWDNSEEGALDDNNAFIRDIYSGVALWKDGEWKPNKHIQFLIIDFHRNGLLLDDGKTPAFDPGWHEWAGTIMRSVTEYLRDNITRINPKIKKVVPMVSRYFIETYFPALADTDFIKHDIFVSDYNNVPEPVSVGDWSSVADMLRPQQPLDVLMSTNWRFVRWANEKLGSTDFDANVSAVDFNGSIAKLSQWVGVEITAPEPTPELEPEPPTPPVPMARDEPLGLDISRWQHPVDFDVMTAHNPPVEFIAMRATIGTYYTDPNFTAAYATIKGVIPRTAYHVVRPDYDAHYQIDHFLATLNGEDSDLPLVLDCEVDAGRSSDQIAQVIYDCANYLKTETGKLPTIYSRTLWINEHVGAKDWLDDYDWWMAYYRRDGKESTVKPIPLPPTISRKSLIIHQTTDRLDGPSFGTTSKQVDGNRWVSETPLAEYIARYRGDDQPPTTPPLDYYTMVDRLWAAHPELWS